MTAQALLIRDARLALALITMMANMYGRDDGHASGIFALTTLLSLFTLPLTLKLFDLAVGFLTKLS